MYCMHMYLKVNNEDKCSRGSITKRLIVPLIASLIHVQECDTKQDKEDNNGGIYTTNETEEEYECIEPFSFLARYVKTRIL